MNKFGYWTIFVALCISVVAAYYSIVGLVAIFASAVVPIIIMGSVLEVGKLTSAIWLHTYWKQSPFLIKAYLVPAVMLLMFITSMGIFGFLSKAHIEQTSMATEGVAQIQRIETEIARNESIIARAEQKILKAEASPGNANATVQDQIDTEQQRIDGTYARIQPAIDEQNQIIQNVRTDDAGRTKPYEDQLTSIQAEVLRLETSAKEYEQSISTLAADTSTVQPLINTIADLEEEITRVTNQLQSNERSQVSAGQSVIGVSSDGAFGENTRRALVAWTDAQRARITQVQLEVSALRQSATATVDAERVRLASVVKDIRTTQMPALKKREVTMLDKINEVRQLESPSVQTARNEIARIRQSAESQIQASQSLIQQLRNSIQIGTDTQIDTIILDQTNKIKESTLSIDNLTNKKYTLEAEARMFEAEVGPVKYIAELIYGKDSNENMLEDAVRWVIIILVIVFDPLAVVLVIAGITIVENARQYTRVTKQPSPIRTTPIIKQEDTHITELETVTDFNSIKGAVRYKGRIYYPTDTLYETVIAQVKENARYRNEVHNQSTKDGINE